MNRLRESLDPTDRALVTLLRADARRSTASIARLLNLSRTAVQARIARLERDGLIWGYTAQLSPDVDDRIAAIVTITIAVRPCHLVTDILLAWPEVETIYSTAGQRDAVIVIRLASTEALSAFADRLGALDGVAQVETTVILAERHSAAIPLYRARDESAKT